MKMKRNKNQMDKKKLNKKMLNKRKYNYWKKAEIYFPLNKKLMVLFKVIELFYYIVIRNLMIILNFLIH